MLYVGVIKSISNFKRPNIESIYKLFRFKTFSLPSYQRNFSWDKSQDIDFINDIYNIFINNRDKKDIYNTFVNDKERDGHFFGSIVSYHKNGDTKNSEVIIDGQQRITISLVTVAIMRDRSFNLKLSKYDKNYQDNKAKLAYIQNESNLILFYKNNPLLMRRIDGAQSDDDYYSYLGNIILAPESKRYSKKSKKNRLNDLSANNSYRPLQLLSKAYHTIDQKIYKIIGYSRKDLHGQSEETDNKINNLYKLFISFIMGFSVVHIRTHNEESALTIYITLNNRGKELSVPDIIKGELAGTLEKGHRHKDIASMMTLWSKISKKLNSDNKEISKFIENYWDARRGHVKEKDLARDISNHIKAADDPQNYAKGMVSDFKDLVDIYESLLDPMRNEYIFNSSSLVDDIRILNNLNMIQYYPVILALKHRGLFTTSNLSILIKAITNIEMRRVINGEHHAKYSSLANSLWENRLNFNGAITNIHQTIIENFSDKVIKNRCEVYTHELYKAGVSIRTLMFLMAKYYHYKHSKDFKDNLYDYVFDNSNGRQLYVVRIFKSGINDMYSNFIGNYVLLNKNEHDKLHNNNGLRNLINCMTDNFEGYNSKSTPFVTNKAIVNSMNTKVGIDIEGNGEIKIDDLKKDDMEKFIKDRQDDFADAFLSIWNMNW